MHCSAGVGRTGTFLAVYKLWLDYINPNVKELSVFPTVLALRKQRCLMVQKKEQYVYIAKCLRSSDQMLSNIDLSPFSDAELLTFIFHFAASSSTQRKETTMNRL